MTSDEAVGGVSSAQRTELRMPSPPNFFTIDVEEWFHVNYDGVDFDACRDKPSNIEASVDHLLSICEKHGVKTTCFILGSVAESNPQVIRRIHDAGHEVASHGYDHAAVCTLSAEAFREELRRTNGLLESITGQKVLGFRAPSWSVTREILPWFYDALLEEGFTYSSSVYPAKSMLFGIEDAPTEPHYPTLEGRSDPLPILEIPCPIPRLLGKKLGLYLRLFPASAMVRFAKKENRQGRPVFFYVHPREVDLKQPMLKLPYWISKVHYFGLKGCAGKVEGIVAGLGETLVRMGDYVARVEAQSASLQA